MRRLAILAIIALVAAGCTGVRQYPAPSNEVHRAAEIRGFPGVRSWGDELPRDTAAQVREVRGQIARRIVAEGRRPNDGRIDVLVLSGGGSDGAYGAGLLNGWSDRGDRPEFGIVTGISTGALIAPFAFVGQDYDGTLERFYTNTKTGDLVIFRFLDALFGKVLGVADTSPLKATLDRILTPDLIRRIATEHRKGRRLLIGTTNLDAQRPVFWNIGRIAASGNPAAATLISDIMLASASIPGAFPPVEFRVTAGDQTYTEMHVDGGVTRQLFFFPVDLRLAEIDPGHRPTMELGTVYVLRNTKLAPVYEPTAPGLVQITARSIATLIKAAGVADIEVIETQARRNGFGLKVTAVPESFDLSEDELFDPVYMRALYDVGYALARDGDPWTEVVPAGKPEGGPGG